MSKIIARLLPLVLLCHFYIGSARAQQATVTPNLAVGDAVVTGFSGIYVPDPMKQRAAGKPAGDLTFINPEGASARIFGIGRPGHIWDGRLMQTPRLFDVLAKDTGQLFGIALDDRAAPNIYLAATSAFGLQLVGRGRDGLIERRKIGGLGAGWMKGQFGLDLQGDPGSIYKVDGATGVVSLFSKILLDGVPNPGPALGNLAYDAAHQQLFVSDMHTGMIHRVAIADGAEAGAPYDHGMTGRPAMNMPPVPFNPANRPNIANSRFDTENPESWGFAPPERRVWGVAVEAGRLFYSARNGATSDGPQIWSVGIMPDGGFAADARLEVEVGAQPGPYPVSDIAFSQTGAMILAQRAPIAAAYDYTTFTKPGEPRVLRYLLKEAKDPPSPGLWKPVPDEYAVGFAGAYRNTNGGVALGYGYGPDGLMRATSCEGSIWSTGQNLRNDPTRRSQLESGGPLLVDGLQGTPFDMVRAVNAPPVTSYFVDYDDRFDDPSAAGHVGSVRILSQPCAATAVSGDPAPTSSPPYVSGPTTRPGGTCVGPNCAPCPLGVYPDGSCKPPIDLAIAKSASEATFDEKTGSWTITFTLLVTNTGAPFAPGGFITIADPIPAGLVVTSATGTGWSPCTGNLMCGYNFGPGIFPNGATLPPLVVTVTTKTPGKYENCATVGLPPSADFQETTLANNKDCKIVELKYPPNRIRVEKVNLDPSCTVELLCRFQIKVINLDPWPFSGPVTIADNTTIPMTIASTNVPCLTPPPTSLPFSCPTNLTIPASGTLIFNVNGVIPAGSVPITGVNPDPINCADISQPPVGTTIVVPKDCKPYKVPCGFACHMTDPQIALIKIEKKADSAQCSPGGTCSYTFTITNVSTTSATGSMPITFIDTMPVGATNYVSSSPLPWGCVPFGAGQIKCLYPPLSIPIGGQISVTVTFQIAPGYNQPTLTNCSEFFVGQGAAAALQRRSAANIDAGALREYLQSRGVAAISKTMPVLKPDDKSCATVNIVSANAPIARPPAACPPGTALKGNDCVKVGNACAPPMVTGPVAGVCVCPQGMVKTGQRCVPPLDCRAPRVANAAGTACVCAPGLVQRGRNCVEPVVCNPPAKLSRRGACECPPDMVARGNSCVPRERRQPQIAPDEIIRIIPRLDSPRGGEGGPRGGGDIGNPRGGGRDDIPRGGQGLEGIPGRR